MPSLVQICVSIWTLGSSVEIWTPTILTGSSASLLVKSRWPFGVKLRPTWCYLTHWHVLMRTVIGLAFQTENWLWIVLGCTSTIEEACCAGVLRSITIFSSFSLFGKKVMIPEARKSCGSMSVLNPLVTISSLIKTCNLSTGAYIRSSRDIPLTYLSNWYVSSVSCNLLCPGLYL